MRSNIRDIIKATKCTEDQANKIEQEINNQWLVDWSEATTFQVFKAAKQVAVELYPQLKY